MVQADARLVSDGSRVLLRKDTWSDEFPIERLDEWIAFYRAMTDPKRKSAQYYVSTLEALERVQQQIQEPSP